MMGIFADWQGKYAAVGIATVPVDPDNKAPLVSHWQKFGLPGSTSLTRKFTDCDGIAFQCGARSGITILDVDVADEALLRQALNRHGDSPLVEQTASGKFHVWYRHNGEPRSIKELWGKREPIDLLGGGLSVTSPTRRTDGACYRFIRGSLADVRDLPVMCGLEDREEQPEASTGNAIRPGERNNTLFTSCLKYANQIKAQDVDQLVRFAMEMNAQFDPPLSKSEAMGCALSAWNYHYRKRNFFTARSLVVPVDAFDKLGANGGDALFLLFRLQCAHWDRDQFNLSQGFAKQLGWTVKRLLRARDKLVKAGEIIRLTPGGRFVGDTPLFAWPTI